MVRVVDNMKIYLVGGAVRDQIMGVVPNDKDYVVVDDAWELLENQLENIDIYPNPTDGIIVVEAPKLRQVSVFNALGQVMLNKAVCGDMVQLDLSGFENGLYWIKVLAQNGAMVRSFVISR